MVKAAKRRKKAEDEEFEIPEFDEVAYMRKEMNAAFASFTLIGLAVILAIILFGITLAGLWPAAFLLGLAATVFLPRLFRLLPWPKVDTSGFQRKDWIGHGGTFFFSWLAIWILLLNAPFVDVTNPVIAAVTVEGLSMAPGGVQNTVRVNGTVDVAVAAFDNVDVASVTLHAGAATFNLTKRAGEPIWTLGVPWTAPSSRDVTIEARDPGDRAATFSFRLILE